MGQIAVRMGWLVLAGVWLALAHLLATGVALVLTGGGPLATRSLLTARYALWPFGTSIAAPPPAQTSGWGVRRTLWLLCAGWWLAATHVIVGVVLCLTVVGLPLGTLCLSLLPTCLDPLGGPVRRGTADGVHRGGVLVAASPAAR